MVECPRCGDRVDQLYPIPAEALAGATGDGPGDEERGDAAGACRWCLNEINEG